ncbi:cytochrome c maturation protein CcmE [candidate division KSB1 bacterium]|nr:cytochrome c maturation protein CcmE [candidate division KSB1 bacterium]
MKKSYIVGAVIIAAALIFAMFSFKSTLTSYVSINEALASEHNVQVAGILVQGSTSYKNKLIFKLKDEAGSEMVVHYNKSKPANFENADKIVAIGKYDKNQNAFLANELLVKCPSKYEGKVSE